MEKYRDQLAQIFTQIGLSFLHSQCQLALENETLRKYFPKSYTPKQMEDTIIKLLEGWYKKRQLSQER